MTYRVRDSHGTILRTLTTTYRWHVLDAPTLTAELAAADLVANPVALGVFRAVRKSR
jgi:hypothetical protein